PKPSTPEAVDATAEVEAAIAAETVAAAAVVEADTNHSELKIKAREQKFIIKVRTSAQRWSSQLRYGLCWFTP
ncbi:MAG: hypothetical protein WBP51_10925, partial [Candidatus Sulfotelmatobacter sp.]